MATKAFSTKELHNDKHILNELMYASYKANRGYGMSHLDAVKIGIGNYECLIRYLDETNPINDTDFFEQKPIL